MKRRFVRIAEVAAAAAASTVIAGCVVEPRGRVVVRPMRVEPAPVYVAPQPAYVPPPPPPAPVVVEPAPVMVPDSYVWDGYEYVGLVGDQYYYLGPGNVWIVAEPFRLARFHSWERYHRDWRAHAIRNEHYRSARVVRHVPERREHRR
ncbi:MAG TPA: hypothetical protein VHH88_10075 [Verrucomicrobiae bacterium]|nr:hypothetical protein [Verrucomicrobiae bacterium]